MAIEDAFELATDLVDSVTKAAKQVRKFICWSHIFLQGQSKLKLPSTLTIKVYQGDKGLL